MQKHRPKSTPWGMSQSEHPKTEGIVFYSTAGHGGYHLSPQRQRELSRRFPWFETFAGGPWYEEDQDCAVVVLAFPELYQPHEIRGAVLSAKSSARPFRLSKPGEPEVLQRYFKWEMIVEWLNTTTEGQRLLKIVSDWESDNSNLWECGSGGTVFHLGYPSGCWQQVFTRVMDGERKTVILSKGYPYQQFYTDEEIAAWEYRESAIA